MGIYNPFLAQNLVVAKNAHTTIPPSPTHPSHSPSFPQVSGSGNRHLFQRRSAEQWLPIFGAIQKRTNPCDWLFFEIAPEVRNWNRVGLMTSETRNAKQSGPGSQKKMLVLPLRQECHFLFPRSGMEPRASHTHCVGRCVVSVSNGTLCL